MRESGTVKAVQSLVERLGHPPDARLVIVSADRIGTTHSSTAGGYRALREGVATTGTIVMPGAWARHAAELYRGEDLGVHLTLNSELDCFRWGPITNAPSLLDGDGGFPRSVAGPVGPRGPRRGSGASVAPNSSGPCCGGST